MTISTYEVRVNARRKLLVAIGAVLLTTPLAALGQRQSKVAPIGYLAASSVTDNPHYAQAFRERMNSAMWKEPCHRVPLGGRALERLPDLAAELVRLRRCDRRCR